MTRTNLIFSKPQRELGDLKMHMSSEHCKMSGNRKTTSVSETVFLLPSFSGNSASERTDDSSCRNEAHET